MWIIIGIVAVVFIGILAFIAKVGAMNNDPVQRELAELIVEMMANEATDDAVMLFTVSSTRAMMMRGLDISETQTRLAHALSLAKPRLNEEGYRVAQQIIRACT